MGCMNFDEGTPGGNVPARGREEGGGGVPVRNERASSSMYLHSGTTSAVPPRMYVRVLLCVLPSVSLIPNNRHQLFLPFGFSVLLVAGASVWAKRPARPRAAGMTPTANQLGLSNNRSNRYCTTNRPGMLFTRERKNMPSPRCFQLSTPTVSSYPVPFLATC